MSTPARPARPPGSDPATHDPAIGDPATLADVGEFGLIRAITSRLPTGRDVLIGPGDDAALVAAPDGRVVITTDLLIEGRHFRRDWSSAYDIGRKAAAQNLADVAAMGARPTALVVGFAAPGDLPVDWAREFADGLRDECALTGASVAGGDVSSAATVMLGITALGDLEGRAPVRRDGARPGDVVVLAGRVGWAEAGLALLRAAEATPHPELLAAHRRPEPPYRLGPVLADLGAHAMCDISDGLLADLGHLAAASAVVIDVDSAALTVPEPMLVAARVLAVDPLAWMLAGGDDHALVACLDPTTVPPAGCAVIGRVLPAPDPGRATSAGPVLVDGREYRARAGWDHFG